MITTHTHYGVEVIVQTTKLNFKEELIKNGYDYIDLPPLDKEVITYTKDGVKKYALIVPFGEDDDKHVYITSQVPDDGDWDLLVKDIFEQGINSAEPMKMKTKLKDLLMKVEEKAHVELSKNKPVAQSMQDLMGAESTKEEELIECMVSILKNVFYSKERLELMNNHDVNPEFLQKILDAYE